MYGKFTFLVLIECKLVINNIKTNTQKGYNVLLVLVHRNFSNLRILAKQGYVFQKSPIFFLEIQDCSWNENQFILGTVLMNWRVWNLFLSVAKGETCDGQSRRWLGYTRALPASTWSKTGEEKREKISLVSDVKLSQDLTKLCEIS